MDHQGKSKKELIIELQKLHQENNFLKESFDKKINEAAKLTEEVSELHWMIEHVGDAAIFRGNYRTMQYEYWSPNVELILGYTAEEMFAMGQPGAIKMINQDDFARVNSLIGELMANGGGPYSIEYRFMAKNGSTHYINESGHAFVDEENVPEYAIGSIRDITDRKQAEEELRESEMRYRALIEASPDAITQSDLQGRILMCNMQTALLHGYKHVEDLIGTSVFKLFSPDELERAGENMKKTLKDGIIKNAEYCFLKKDGSRFIAELSAAVISDSNGNPTSFIAITRDITERKQTQEQISDALKYIKTIFEVSPIGIVTYKESGEVISANHAAAMIAGATIEQLQAQNFQELKSWERSGLKEAANSALAANDERNIEVHDISTFGKESWFSARFVPFKHQGRKELLALLSDISDRKRAELLLKIKTDELEAQNEEYLQINEELYQTNKELRLAKEKAEESDRLKTAFLQNMSHEIRTPMNAIMGFSDLLKDENKDKPKLEKYTTIISQRCNDLLNIIDDILDIAKIESGQLPVNIEECNLTELFAELTSFFIEYQNRIGKQHIKFSLQSICAPSENIIVTDKVKLKQIFINLINNAFKYTDEGEIEGGCKFDENHNLLFYVSDTGIGIPPDKQEIVFERFVQLNQVSNKNIGGTGIGLSIVKGLVNLLSGEIFLVSELGKGSTFTFTIPYNITHSLHVEPSVINKSTKISLSNKTILIVEDDFYNAEYLKEIISGFGLNILQAENGKEAVELSISQPVDMVLMDIRLPDIDGYEATRQIRMHKSKLKIIAQTAYASQNEKQKAIEAGCDDYISKPTKKNILLLMLNKHLT